MAERTSKLKLSQFTAAEEDSTLFQTWSRNLNSPQGNNDLKKIDDFAADVQHLAYGLTPQGIYTHSHTLSHCRL